MVEHSGIEPLTSTLPVSLSDFWQGALSREYGSIKPFVVNNGFYKFAKNSDHLLK